MTNQSSRDYLQPESAPAAEVTAPLRHRRAGWALASVAVLLTLVLSLSPLLTTAQSNGPERPRSPVFIEPGVRGPSVVLVDPGVDPAAVAADNGVRAERVFTTATTAFATSLEEDQVTQLANDERVRAIVIDHEITAAEVSTGVERIGAATSPMSTIGTGATTAASIAILDSGVSSHPDLNVVGGTDACAPNPTGSYADVYGHGTHVAGIAAALDNGVGVVGVAPGASIYAVRILDARGSGTLSTLICGLDWVAANASLIDVVNMSVTSRTGVTPAGSCDESPLHQAVCTVAALGIPLVAAAGNYSADASLYIPAAYPEVITVSSFTDTNGRPGGGGGSCSGRADDFFSGFSNRGPAVDIMAPGDCIYSTKPGGYGTISGTSMAAPHVAGALALYIANNGAGGAVSWLLNSAAVRQDSTFGIEGGDDDGYAEPVLYIGNGSLNPTATPTRQATATPTTGVRPPRPGGSTATATATRAASATPQATNTPTVSPTPAASATPTSVGRPSRPGRGTATAPAPATSTPTRVAGSTPTPTVTGPTRPPRIRSTGQVPIVTPTAGTVRPTPSSTPSRPPRIRWASQAEMTASPTAESGSRDRESRAPGETTTAEVAAAGTTAPTVTPTLAWPTATPTSVLPTATPTQVPPTPTPELAPTEQPPTEVPPTEGPVESVPTEIPTEAVPTEVPSEAVPTEAPTAAETPNPLPVYDVTDTLDQATAWYAVDATVETAWYLPVPTPTEVPVVEEPTAAGVPTDGSDTADGTERQRDPEGTAGDVPVDAAAVESVPTEDLPLVEPEDLHLTIDLGSEQQIETVRWLLDDYRYADSMEIQVSLDGETWTTVAWSPDVAEWQVLEGEWQEAELYGTTARYVRFMFPNWNGDEVVGGLAEVEIIPVALPTE